MKYSKELHDKLRNRTGLHIFNHQVGVDSEDIDTLLDEIERLQAEVDRLTPRNVGEVLAGFKVLISDYIPADTILLPRIAGERVGLVRVSPPPEGE